jgi:hypothetical protein
VGEDVSERYGVPLTAVRRKALEAIMGWLKDEGYFLAEDLIQAGYAICSLVYDGFVTVYTSGELYPVNYLTSQLPAHHRMRYSRSGERERRGEDGQLDLLPVLDWVDAQPYGQWMP